MIFTFHNNILSYYNYFIIHDPTPFSLEGLLSSALCHLSLDRRRIYPPLSAAFDLQTMIIMSWCRIQQSWDARGWFFGAQVFGEKFLTGDLPRYLKSEPIPHKVGHSALSAAPVFAVMSSVNDGLLVYNLFTCFAKNLVVICLALLKNSWCLQLVCVACGIKPIQCPWLISYLQLLFKDFPVIDFL
jgi:hypothetical protein